jgi:exo-1,4-beta-D-glucosaminidase
VPKTSGARMKLQAQCCLPLAGVLVVAVVSAGFSPAAFAESPETATSEVVLRAGWMLESACQVRATGEQISRPGFRTEGWHVVTVPSTVVAALVADKTFPDPYFGTNLRSIPGASYPLGQNFALLAMPKGSPFRCSWWYRTEFRLPAGYSGHRLWLDFEGINNRANVWVNGQRIANSRDVAGAYRTYEFDITALAEPDRVNVLAVETIAQTENDLGISWVDWNPVPPDKNLGLWRPVYLRASGAVTIRDPQAVTHFPDGSLDRAELTVEAILHNATSRPVSGTLAGEIEQISFQQTVVLAPGESRTVRFTPPQFPELRIAHPKIWWPAQMGASYLH